MRQFYLTLLLILSTLSAFADDARLVIRHISGGQTVMELSTNPVITFDVEKMIVTSDLATITMLIDDVETFLLDDGTSGVREVTPTPKFLNGRVVLCNLQPRETVRIHALDGRTVCETTADVDGQAAILLDQLPKGAYVISASTARMKIINK